MLTFAQCAKNDDVLNTINEKAKVVDRTSRQVIMDEIIANAKHAATGNVKGRSTDYSIDDAIDLLDETLNYSYCRPGTPLTLTEVICDTVLLPLSTTNTVSSDDISTIYDATSAKLGTQYHHLSLTNKQPWTFSIERYGNPHGNNQALRIIFSIAYGQYISSEPVFDDNANYSFAYNGGLCNANTPGNGAPELLRNKLKYSKITVSPNSIYYHRGKNVWVCNDLGANYVVCAATGISPFLASGTQVLNQTNLSGNDSPTNINDWKLFRQISSYNNYDECLSGDVEMPYNFTQMGNIIDANNPNTQTYTVGNVWVGSNKVQYQNTYIPFHNMVMEYFFYTTATSNQNTMPCTDCP